MKMQALLDLGGTIPSFIHVSDSGFHELNVLDLLLPKPGDFYLPRRTRYRDPDTGEYLVFLTNRAPSLALNICALYQRRWQVELFFK